MKTPIYFKTLMVTVALAILTVFTAKSQIAITENDMPQVGRSYIIANDTAPTVTPGSAGANVTWNLSAINNTFADTTFALAASGTPYFYYFPASNLASRTNLVGLGQSYEYTDMSADSAIVQGTVVPFGGLTVFGTNIPATKTLIFPATYNLSWSGSYVNVQKYSISPGDSVKGVILFGYSITIDGWGTVTTPAGSYNALRVNTIFTPKYDSVYENVGSGWILVGTRSPVPNEVYAWYANFQGVPVAQLNLDTAGKSVTGASYLKNPTTGINEISNNSYAQVYPNPASSVINVVVKSANQDGYIKIIDLTGREIESTPFSNGKTQFNTSGYANGMYLYFITDVNGSLLDKGKFTVSH